jgi:hypothetical protein
MARKRMIDPSWLESQSLGKCSRTGRLLFIGLITLADDEGRLRGDPVFLRNTIFPYDEDLKTEDIIIELEALQESDCIRFYSVNSLNFILLPKWRGYQRIDRPTASKLPECPNNWEKKSIVEDSSRTRRGLVTNGIEFNRIEFNRTEFNITSDKSRNSDSVESVTSKAIVKIDPDKELKKTVEQSFIAISGEFASWPKERQNIKRIIQIARRDCPDRTEEYIRAMLEKFKELTEGNDKFYSKLEFSPSKLVGCWMNVRKLLRGDFEKQITPEDEELIERMMGK